MLIRQYLWKALCLTLQILILVCIKTQLYICRDIYVAQSRYPDFNRNIPWNVNTIKVFGKSLLTIDNHWNLSYDKNKN